MKKKPMEKKIDKWQQIIDSLKANTKVPVKPIDLSKIKGIKA
jgi:hypothetical protein